MKRLGIIGATGLVGMSVLETLKEEKLTGEFELFLFVSDKSDGKVLVFDDKHFRLIKLDDDFVKFNLDYAIFLTSESVSSIWVEKFAKNGIKVIDNSSAFRMKTDIPLIVPEINAELLDGDERIIANPNCSTIQLVVVLDRLRKLYEIDEVVVSSYQSVSGAGRDALLDLDNNTTNVFEHSINNNFIAQIGKIEANGNCTEENKIINETKKILNEEFEVFATTVRVPIAFCHGESVMVRFKNDIDVNKLKKSLKCDYIIQSDDLFYPSECAKTNETYVCRMRSTSKNVIQFFIIADNLRRGASYNAVKILEIIREIR